MNPWGLSDRQEQILDSLVECGCNKLVSRQLQMNLRTLEGQLARITLRVGAKSRMHLAIQWDRYRRANAS
jgi:DNA-binding CsgD family transcriptional regulator